MLGRSERFGHVPNLFFAGWTPQEEKQAEACRSGNSDQSESNQVQAHQQHGETAVRGAPFDVQVGTIATVGIATPGANDAGSGCWET